MEKEVIKALADYQKTNKKLEKLNVPQSNFWTKGKEHNAQTSFFEPYEVGDNGIANIRTISKARYGAIPCATLRHVAQKAWIINVCINHVIKKCKPYFKPTSDSNKRGFIILKDGEALDLTKKNKEAQQIKDFILNCGSYEDSSRDDFTKYSVKLLRDLLTMDQIATEIQNDNQGHPIAFFAIDGATVERVLPGQKQAEETGIKYLQIIHGQPAAAYTDKEIVFDYENPRTDIYHSFYGYSYVEQAVDLITAEINAFTYNAGNFTENKLPRGMLLIEGDASQETVEEMEDYISEIMSGGPLNQWRIPIIPSGKEKGEGGGIKWQELNGKNRDMEFGLWLDFLTSAVVATFGCSMDELGIQSQKSQNLFEHSGSPQMNESKSLILGDILSFYAQYINKILKKVNPSYTIEFVGYEQLDQSKIADIDEKEGRTHTTVNELREKYGQKPLDLNKIDNPADLPMNPQLIQAWQSIQAQKQGGDGMGMDGGEGGEDDQSWQDYGNDVMGNDEGENTEEAPEENPENNAENPSEEEEE